MGRHGDAANTLSTGAPFLLRLERLDLLIWSVNAKRWLALSPRPRVAPSPRRSLQPTVPLPYLGFHRRR